MTEQLSLDADKTAISVSALNRQAKGLLEDGIGRVWVEGEISNLSRPASGHVYFSLKDSTAQVGAAWFRQRQRGPTHNLKNGDQVLVYGQVSIYEARGNFQLIVAQLEPAGEGALRRKFELLKSRLSAEGLFSEEHKSPLPALPKRIGIVTSPSGAAIRDILSVLGRRFPSIPVVVYPAAVQGVAAAAQLVDALRHAERRDECDVLVVSRGGGSLEDLWPFNEETVARAVFECPIPVISAVGHEIDFTICDFVADLRAPTPSAAAELVVPDVQDWLRKLAQVSERLILQNRRSLEDLSQAIDWLHKRLFQSSPVTRVSHQKDELRNLRQSLVSATLATISAKASRLGGIRTRLLQESPAANVQKQIGRKSALDMRLRNAAKNSIRRVESRLNLVERTLHSIGPQATLDRGYAIVTSANSGQLLTDARDVQANEQIVARLAKGSLEATVKRANQTGDNE